MENIFLDECSQNLDNGMKFINLYSSNDSDKKLYYINLLDKQILKLDTIEDRQKRKNYILATQNIILQLESLDQKDKPILLISNNSSRNSYLPTNRNTH